MFCCFFSAVSCTCNLFDSSHISHIIFIHNIILMQIEDQSSTSSIIFTDIKNHPNPPVSLPIPGNVLTNGLHGHIIWKTTHRVLLQQEMLRVPTDDLYNVCSVEIPFIKGFPGLVCHQPSSPKSSFHINWKCLIDLGIGFPKLISPQ